MPIYFGKSRDGSDMQEFGGMFVSPDGKEWSSEPYTNEQHLANKEQKKQQRIYKEIYDYCASKIISFRDAYNEISRKESGLSARCKKMLKEIIENEHEEDDND